MTITIKDKTITLKKTFRSLIAYEQATKQSFNPSTITEIIMYFFCVVIASDMELELTYDDFMDWLDDNPTTLQEFSEWIVKQDGMESVAAKKKTTKTKKKTK